MVDVDFVANSVVQTSVMDTEEEMSHCQGWADDNKAQFLVGCLCDL